MKRNAAYGLFTMLSFMRTLLKRPAYVKSYFKHPKVLYAA